MANLPIEIYRTEHIKALEQLAFNELGVTSSTLMQRAGAAAWEVLKQEWPQAKKIGVVCGNGSNGGDGYVVAMLAKQHGFEVEVWQIGDTAKLTARSQHAMEAAKAAQVPMQPWSSSSKFSVDVIVDALFGTGLRGEVKPRSSRVIQAMNEAGCPIISIDIPSGVHGNHGTVLGTAVQAAVTVTFIGLKAGLMTGGGVACRGKLYCDPLGLPTALYEKVPVFARRLCIEPCKKLFPPRNRDAHKGQFGHVLVVGGDYSMPGAALMSAEAAARIGAGVVSVATRPEHMKIITEERPELLCQGVNDGEDLKPLLEKATVVVVGPGLGRSSWAESLLHAVFASSLPLVVDADALNLLSDHRRHRENWILTPHAAEAGRLLGKSTLHVQKDRYTAIRALEKRFSGIVVLKGAGTLVLGRDHQLWVCDAGNPGMASGGMGDILTGVIASLVAQGFELEEAARTGVCLHAYAGDMAAAEGERGLLAMDLMKYLRKLVNPS